MELSNERAKAQLNRQIINKPFGNKHFIDSVKWSLKCSFYSVNNAFGKKIIKFKDLVKRVAIMKKDWERSGNYKVERNELAIIVHGMFNIQVIEEELRCKHQIALIRNKGLEKLMQRGNLNDDVKDGIFMLQVCIFNKTRDHDYHMVALRLGYVYDNILGSIPTPIEEWIKTLNSTKKVIKVYMFSSYFY